MTTPWGTTPAWFDLPPEPRAILFGLAEELWKDGISSTVRTEAAIAGRYSLWLTTKKGAFGLLMIVDGKILVLPVKTDVPSAIAPIVDGLSPLQGSYPLADPDSISRILAKVKQLAGVKATSGT